MVPTCECRFLATKTNKVKTTSGPRNDVCGETVSEGNVMSGSRSAALRKMVRSAVALGLPAATDRELLRRFARENDKSAFETLVNRHTAMVFGVCRRALPKVQDAEDACQATFLVLANRARDGRWQESVANWLYATARKVAHNARVAAERRLRRETPTYSTTW